MFLLIYVDDLLIIGNNLDMITEVKSALSKKFRTKDLQELKFYWESKQQDKRKDWVEPKEIHVRVYYRFGFIEIQALEGSSRAKCHTYYNRVLEWQGRRKKKSYLKILVHIRG